ncbi:MAG: cytochrome C [Deltaproteobacteria bacterium]|nr:cytochrome C [Deltaproteobacteria bacterium]
MKLLKYLTGFLIYTVIFIGFHPEIIHAKDVKDTQSLCYECHAKRVEELTKKAIVHQPVKDGKCTGCHNPHASKHSGLLAYTGSALCYNCHDQKKGFAGIIVHKPVAEGNCLVCHDAHSSDRKGLLKKTEAEGCFSCHAKEGIIAKKNVHPEVKRGRCTACHNPHSSDREGLLIRDRKSLCAGCHSGADAAFVKAHFGYKVGGTDCLGCHSPHSSDRKGLMKASLHKPFAENKCTACHPVGASTVIKNNSGLCTECHKASLAGFDKINSHLIAAATDNFCISCHNPHASDEKNLLKDKEARVCYGCHNDTKEYVARSNHKHPRLETCSDCHTSHGSNNQFFLTKGSDTCAMENCHAAQGRFTHPIGEKIIDPRSKTPMNCSTCHNPMGSPESAILRFEKDRELCIQCHQV